MFLYCQPYCYVIIYNLFYNSLIALTVFVKSSLVDFTKSKFNQIKINNITTLGHIVQGDENRSQGQNMSCFLCVCAFFSVIK